MIQKPLWERMKVLAQKHNVPVSRIEEVERVVWEFVYNEMSSGCDYKEENYENILLKYLGTFYVKSSALRKLREHHKKF